MDDALANRYARELTDAIADAVADDPRVEACRARARAAGFELRVTLEAVVGFTSRVAGARLADTPAPERPRPARLRWTTDMTAADRRFLRSLRIATGEAREEEPR